jgi:hypothetical protein
VSDVSQIVLPSDHELRRYGGRDTERSVRTLTAEEREAVVAGAMDTLDDDLRRLLMPRATVANDSIIVSPDGSGVTAAMHTPTGLSKTFQTTMDADAEGHVLGTIPTYMLYQEPRVTTAAATDLWDFHVGASATHTVRIMGLWMIGLHTAATAFTLPWRFDILRTSAVGTGGTAFSADAAAPAAGIVSINRTDTNDPALATLDANITARSVPTAGATAETLLFPTAILPEETSPGALSQQFAAYLNLIPITGMREFPRLRAGKGIKVRQITATASTGFGFGWLMMFAVI